LIVKDYFDQESFSEFEDNLTEQDVRENNDFDPNVRRELLIENRYKGNIFFYFPPSMPAFVEFIETLDFFCIAGMQRKRFELWRRKFRGGKYSRTW